MTHYQTSKKRQAKREFKRALNEIGPVILFIVVFGFMAIYIAASKTGVI